MKKILKQVKNAVGYFAVYFVIQNIISAIAGFVVVAKYSTELSAARSAGFEQYMAEYQKYLAGYNGICLILTAIAVLLAYFFIEKAKKSGLAKETDIRRVSGMHIGLTIIAATGAMFFLNFMLNILPIPKELLGSLSSGMKNLSAYPFWQAILANAILIPIMEEVVFRGYLFNRLSKAMPEIVAALITSVIFGLCHGGIVWATWAFVVGMIICVFRIKTGSIIPGMIFHIIMNTFGTLTSYTTIFDGITETGMKVLTAAGGIILLTAVVITLMGKKTAVENNSAEVTVSSAKV
ncbi:MAG: CPBP family intramembrane metalloprotease [Clostridiales bacterium]|nr:CPBP family intramembrane metalloprotease [Clostridiales bacterium]